MSGIAVQHVDDGYSRRGNLGGSLLHKMISILFIRQMAPTSVVQEVESLRDRVGVEG